MTFGWQQAVLVVTAVLFLGFLLVKMRPGGTHRAALTAEVRAAQERARIAETPRARAEALLDAGVLAVRAGRRWMTATGFFLRAMNADPTSSLIVQRLIQTFHARRPRLLEKILWRRLGTLPWDDAHQAVLGEVAVGLAQLYDRQLRDRSRAEVMRRVAKTFGRG